MGVRCLGAPLLFARLVAADLPVHCVKHEISGEWDFHLGPSSPFRSSCGHARPDDPQKQPAHSLAALGGSVFETKRLNLEEPNTVSGAGTWSMVYDEGFSLHHSGASQFSFR